MSDYEAIAVEREAQRAKVAATHPLIKSVVLTIRFEPDSRAPFAPWLWELEMGDHGLKLTGRGHHMAQAAEWAAEALAEYMSHVSNAGRGITH